MYGIRGNRGWVAAIDAVSGRAEWTRDESCAMGSASFSRMAELAEGIGEAKRLPEREVIRRAAPVR